MASEALGVSCWLSEIAQFNLKTVSDDLCQRNYILRYEKSASASLFNHHKLFCSDLGRMFKLVSKIQDGLGELRNLLETHVFNQGDAAIQQCADAALNVRDNNFQIRNKFYHFLEIA